MWTIYSCLLDSGLSRQPWAYRYVDQVWRRDQRAAGQVLVVGRELTKRWARAWNAAAGAACSTVSRHGAVLAVDQSGAGRTLRSRLQVQVILNTTRSTHRGLPKRGHMGRGRHTSPQRHCHRAKFNPFLAQCSQNSYTNSGIRCQAG